jgi:Zn-dependent protease
MNEVLMKALEVVVIVAGIFYSIILHEIAHGLAALSFGDTTAKDAKRLSLNPIRHVDLVGTIILPAACYIFTLFGAPLFLFGWAKPVPINPYQFKNRRAGMIIVSLAGVFVNFLITALMFFLYFQTGYQPMLTIASVNIMLVTFNLIPFPPLDGYNFVTALLPERISQKIRINDRVFMGILLILMATGLLRYIYTPLYNLLAGFFLSIFRPGGIS